MKTKKNEGITLIALVITIIVMLILVGVTLNITLDENGIIEKTKKARRLQEEESMYEQVLAAMIYDRTGVNLEDTKSSISALGYDCGVISNNQFIVTATGKYGTYTYTVTKSSVEKGTIEDFAITIAKNYDSATNKVTLTVTPTITASTFSEEEAMKILTGDPNCNTLEQFVLIMYNSNPDTPDYENFNALSAAFGGATAEDGLAMILGPNNCSSIQEMAARYYVANAKTLKINDAEVTVDSWSNNTATYTLEENGTYSIALELDGKVGSDTTTITEIEEHVGKYVWYDVDGDGQDDGTDELCIILYNNSTYGIQLVSKNSMEAFDMYGQTDWENETIIENADIIETDDELSDIEKAIYLFNNRTLILNSYCDQLYKNTEYVSYVRSVGSNPLLGTSHSNEVQVNYFTTADIPEYTGNWFDSFSGKIIKEGNVLGEEVDVKRMEYLGIKVNGVTTNYEIAATNTYYYSTDGRNEVMGHTAYVDINHEEFTNASMGSLDISSDYTNYPINWYGVIGVRPVVTLKSNVTINTTSGEGTAESPYTLQVN